MKHSRSTKMMMLMISMLFIQGALVSGCASKSNSNAATSNSLGYNYNYANYPNMGLGGGVMINGAPQARCNKFTASTGTLEGQLAVHVGPNYQITLNKMRLRLNRVANELLNSDTAALQIYRWSAVGTTTQKNFDSTPLQFQIELAESSAFNPKHLLLSTKTYTKLNRSDLQELATTAARYGIGSSSLNDFLSKIDIVVMNVDLTWQVLMLAIYGVDSLEGTSVNLAVANALMPPFDADPNYYQTHHSTLTNQLHPFWNIRSTAGQNWAVLAESYCF